MRRGLLLLLLLLALATAWPSAPALAAPSCSGIHLIEETFPSGARWRLCWDVRSREAVVYRELHYTPAGGSEQKVLEEASLAQIHVPYDDNGARFHDITDYGAGGGNLNDLTSADCPGGVLLQDGSKDVICRRVERRGAAWDAALGQEQGWLLELFSVSHIGAYNYIPSYRLYDDGTVEVVMGATGQLQRFEYNDPGATEIGWPLNASATRIGISHIHNYYFRLDFDLGGTATDDVVEQIDVLADASRATRVKTVTPFTSEAAADVAPSALRSWRVRDAVLQNGNGHALSYELVPLESGHRDEGPAYEPFTHDDFYVTRYSPCEQYASHNNQLLGCGDDLQDFVDGESLLGQDVVLWYGLTFHHIPRDEDENRMHAHWNGFRLEPRDWSDATPLATLLPPVWTDPGAQEDAEGDPVSLTLSASDPDGRPVVYGATGLPPGLSLDPLSGEISGTLDYTSAGVHAVTATADDGNDRAEQVFGWTIAETNRAPLWSDPGSPSDAEGQSVSLVLSAVDPDGQTVGYTATGLPPGLALDPGTGAISGTLDYASAGSWTVIATASDGVEASDQPFTWTVVDTNRAPLWTDPGPQLFSEGDSVLLLLEASDPDGQALEYGAVGLPPGLALDTATGEIAGSLGYTTAGTWNVTATASDGIDPVEQPFTIEIADAVPPPAIPIPALPPGVWLALGAGFLAAAGRRLRGAAARHRPSRGR